MTPSHRTSPSQAVASVLDPSHVEAEAARLGVVSRRRKVDAWILVWVLVLGFQVGTARTLEGLRQAYERAAGHTLARSAFHSRLSESLARLLRTLAEAVMRDLGPAMGVRDDVAHQRRRAA